MKRLIMILCLIINISVLASCGEPSAQISAQINSELEDIDKKYNNGEYYTACKMLESLNNSYKHMSKEQKNKYDNLNSLSNYAKTNYSEIRKGLDQAKDLYYDQMYYESSQALSTVIANYNLPPKEKAEYDDTKLEVDESIIRWKVQEEFLKAESEYNKGNFLDALNILNNMNLSNMNYDEKMKRKSYTNTIRYVIAVRQVDKYCNKGMYASAMDVVGELDTSTLTDEQVRNVEIMKNNLRRLMNID